METGFEEIKELFRQTDCKMRETDRRMQETDRLIREMSAETDRKMQETDRKMQETDRKMQQVSRNLGDIGNRLGEFVENLLAPGLVRFLRERGVQVTEVYQRVRSLDHRAEIDLLAANRSTVVAVEVKSKLDIPGVDRHLAKLDRFKRLFPRYEDCVVLGAVAAMQMPADAAEHAESRGLFVLVPSGEELELLNEDGFEPRKW
ncbi:MAG: DUF3782 domain-containing protein [Polyangia bacterium]